MDVEDADVCEAVNIHEHPGLLVVKNGIIRLAWACGKPSCIYDETEDVRMKIAESILVELYLFAFSHGGLAKP